METLLFAAEPVEEDGTYKPVVQDVVRDTVRITPVPESAVDKLPTLLSVLSPKLGTAPARGRW